MKRLPLLLLAALAATALGVQAATKYEINVGGVEVTSSNASNVTGGDIKSGTVTYNSSTKTLTLTNVTITRTGGDNYGVHTRKPRLAPRTLVRKRSIHVSCEKKEERNQDLFGRGSVFLRALPVKVISGLRLKVVKGMIALR